MYLCCSLSTLKFTCILNKYFQTHIFILWHSYKHIHWFEKQVAIIWLIYYLYLFMKKQMSSIFQRKTATQLCKVSGCSVLPEVHASKWIWVVYHLQDSVCTQRTKTLDADGHTGWQSGTGFYSAGILAGTLLHWHPVGEFYYRRNESSWKSHSRSLRWPGSKEEGETELWRRAGTNSKCETSSVTDDEQLGCGSEKDSSKQTNPQRKVIFAFHASVLHLHVIAEVSSYMHVQTAETMCWQFLAHPLLFCLLSKFPC